MACSGCGASKSIVPSKSSNSPDIPVEEKASQPSTILQNLRKAAESQPDKLKWFKDGATGILKCLAGVHIYDDEDIQKNREVCRNCPHSTKTSGKLVATSQCMAIDESGKACGCFILCKSTQGTCPLNKWTTLTISQKKYDPEI